MRSLILLFIVSIMTLSACTQHLCPTYSDSGARRGHHAVHHSPNHHP